MKLICEEYWPRDKQIKTVEPQLSITTSVEDACQCYLAGLGGAGCRHGEFENLSPAASLGQGFVGLCKQSIDC